MHVGRESGRGKPVGDDEVQHRHRDEHCAEQPEQQGLTAQHTPEHVAAADADVPEVVDVETRQEPGRHQQHHHDHGDGDDDDSAAVAEAAGPALGPGEIGGRPHEGGGYRSQRPSRMQPAVAPATAGTVPCVSWREAISRRGRSCSGSRCAPGRRHDRWERPRQPRPHPAGSCPRHLHTRGRSGRPPSGWAHPG